MAEVLKGFEAAVNGKGFGKGRYPWAELLNLDGEFRFQEATNEKGELVKHFGYQARKVLATMCHEGKLPKDQQLTTQVVKHDLNGKKGYAIRLLKGGKPIPKAAPAKAGK